MNQDIQFSEKRVENIRNFGNKIWNASRFVIMNLEGFDSNLQPPTSNLQLEDRWILSRLNRVIETVNSSFGSYDLDAAARALYEFIWGEFCDWYIELAKPRLRGQENERRQAQTVLHHVLESTLRLLHPIMPFITEEIWQALPHEGESIMTAKFPESDPSMIDADCEARMSLLIEGTRVQRDLKASAGIPLKTKVTARLHATSALSDEAKSFLENTAGTSIEAIDAPPEDPGKYLAGTVVDLGTFYIPVPEVDRDKELAKIDAELESVAKELARSQGKLSGQQFVSRAPAQVVEKERRIVAELEEKKAKLEERKDALNAKA
jgi:valyl-tRNA synthetase